jgi:hypothetical protein
MSSRNWFQAGLFGASVGLAFSCAPKPPAGVNGAALETAMSKAVGDIGVCVMVVKTAGGEPVWTHGTFDNCHARLPTCAGGPAASAADRAPKAAAGEVSTNSCSSDTPGMSVAWTLGPAGSTSKGLAYVAVLQSPDEKALPGRELAERVNGAFTDGGL